MYCLSDKQVEYILNDISARGVSTESLQQNLLDHVCCIIEHNLEADGDFEGFYLSTIQTFYRSELREIEVETALLLNFKNYYAMKKIMITSGLISGAAFIAGSFFKAMHWPGASALLFGAILLISCLFLPLLVIFKNRESADTRDKVMITVGALIGALVFLGALFSVMHWPHAREVWLSAMALSIFGFIPFYFFTGMRSADKKANTIIVTVILVGITCMQFTMINLRPAGGQNDLRINNYLQQEQLLHKLQQVRSTPGQALYTDALMNSINTTCEELKNMIWENETGQAAIANNPDPKFFNDHSVGADFDGGRGSHLLEKLKAEVVQYNTQATTTGKQVLPVQNTFLSLDANTAGPYSNLVMLTSLTQLQQTLLTCAGEQINAVN